MTPAIASPKLLTVEEYARLPDDGHRTELVRGRIVEVTAAVHVPRIRVLED